MQFISGIKGCQYDSFEKIIKNNHFDLLHKSKLNNYSIPISLCIKYNRLEMIKYFVNLSSHLLSHNVTEYMADCAAEYGHLHILIYFCEELGILCSQRGANLAAENGHINVIQYLRKFGVFCTKYGANEAARNGHLDVIQDIHKIDGILCDYIGLVYAQRSCHRHVTDYLQQFDIGRNINR